MSILRSLVIGVTAGAAIVSSQLTLDSDQPWDLGEDQVINVASIRLETASDCADLTSMVRDIADRLEAEGPVGPIGFGGDVVVMEDSAGAAVQGRSTSADAGSVALPLAPAPTTASAGGEDGGKVVGTNVQEQGVDETDVIKTDGRTIFVLSEGKVTSVDAETLERLDRIGWNNRYPNDMLLSGDRLILLENAWREPKSEGTSKRGRLAPDIYYGESFLRITVIDASEPSALDVASVVEVDGGLVAARMIDGVARIVTSNAPQMMWGGPMPMVMVDSIGGTVRAAEADDVDAEDILPDITVDRGDGPRSVGVPCQQTYIAPKAETLESTTVFSLDPYDPEPRGTTTALAGSGTVYANTRSLYIARANWNRRGIERSEIHRFDITDPNEIRYVSVGTVRGYLLNQFAMSEHEGLLRIATTTSGTGGDGPAGTSQSQVMVLRETGDSLVKIGEVDGLGLDERIFAVRFIGDTAYVVTFRQIDPLYVVDLSDPTAPVVAGELKIPGYSAYLHPVGEGLLIGVGQDADETGRTRGVQVSLFDVRDPANPKRISKLNDLGDYSPVEHDHRAFQFIADRNLIVVPASQWRYFDGAVEPDAPREDEPDGTEPGSSGGGADGDSGSAPEIVTLPPISGGGEGGSTSSDGSQVEDPGDVPAEPKPSGDYREPELRAFAYLIEVTSEGLREVGRISHRQLAAAGSARYRMGEMQRAIAIGDTLYTLSDAGLLATDMDRLENLAALPW